MEELVEKTVTVSFVNPPTEERKPGSIRLDDKSYISVWEKDIPQFQPKGTYNILCKPFGKSLTFVRMANNAAATAPAQRMPVSNAQAPIVSNQAEEIFITGIVGRAMGSGQFDIEDISALTLAAANAWRNRNGVAKAAAKPQTAPLADDEIGF